MCRFGLLYIEVNYSALPPPPHIALRNTSVSINLNNYAEVLEEGKITHVCRYKIYFSVSTVLEEDIQFNKDIIKPMQNSDNSNTQKKKK